MNRSGIFYIISYLEVCMYTFPLAQVWCCPWWGLILRKLRYFVCSSLSCGFSCLQAGPTKGGIEYKQFSWLIPKEKNQSIGIFSFRHNWHQFDRSLFWAAYSQISWISEHEQNWFNLLKCILCSGAPSWNFTQGTKFHLRSLI